MIDNFEVKYVGGEYIDHLLSALHKFYIIEKNRNRDKIGGIAINLDRHDNKKSTYLCLVTAQKHHSRSDTTLWEKKYQQHQHSVLMYGVTIQDNKMDDPLTFNEQDKLLIQ